MKNLEFCGPMIRFYREQKGMDIGRICIQTGIQKPLYVELEKGKKEVLLSTWKRICDAVGIDFVYLFKNEDVYEELYKDSLHALLYDDMNEQQKLFVKLKEEELKQSILFPKFVLVRFIYEAMNKERPSDKLMGYLELFKDVYSLSEQCIYYDYYGFILQKAKQYDQAKKYYKKAEALATLEHKDMLYYHMGMLHYKLNEPLKALHYFRRAYGMFEKSWNINRLLYTHGSIGICYIRMAEFVLAKNQLEETIRLAQQYKNDYVISTTYDNLAFNSFKMRDYDACIRYASKAIEKNTNYAYLYFYLSYSYLMLGKNDEASHWILASKQIDMDKAAQGMMYYAQLLMEQKSCTHFLQKLYEYLVEEEFYELQKFILMDLADIFQKENKYENESKCLRELLRLSK